MECNLRSQLPKQDIGKFGGDVAKFSIFKQSFISQIESRLSKESEKLHYLYQYTAGKPQSFVEACLNMNPEEGYRSAWSMLEEKYGNIERMGAEYVNRLLSRESVSRDDCEALEDFHVELLKTKHAVARIPYGKAELENPRTLKLLVSKLPYTIQEKWRHRAVDTWEKRGRSVGYDDLMEMVRKEATAANHPLFGKSDVSGKMKQRENVRSRDYPRITINAVSERACWLCERGQHDLENCEVFTRKYVGERWVLIKENNLCFLCLKSGHRAAGCTGRLSCETCKGWHHILLHEDLPAERRSYHQWRQTDKNEISTVNNASSMGS